LGDVLLALKSWKVMDWVSAEGLSLSGRVDRFPEAQPREVWERVNGKP
jgi:hypothetical protein